MTKVVTYAHAYLPGRTINLCETHEDHPSTDAIFGTVGQVQYGSHRGQCDVCAAKRQTPMTAELANDAFARGDADYPEAPYEHPTYLTPAQRRERLAADAKAPRYAMDASGVLRIASEG